jgi:hypothetical protein
VQKIYAVPEVAQQRQLKTTQGGFGRAGCASKRLDTVQIIEEKFREAGLMFKNPRDEFVDVQTAVERDARKGKRQRDGFGTAQGFNFPSPAKANQQRRERL